MMCWGIILSLHCLRFLWISPIGVSLNLGNFETIFFVSCFPAPISFFSSSGIPVAQMLDPWNNPRDLKLCIIFHFFLLYFSDRILFLDISLNSLSLCCVISFYFWTHPAHLDHLLCFSFLIFEFDSSHSFSFSDENVSFHSFRECLHFSDKAELS